MSEEKINISPLDGWTKEQIKSALKAHSKRELLEIALNWRIIAENCMQQTKQNNDDVTTEDLPHEADS